jgi:hypothetical protein
MVVALKHGRHDLLVMAEQAAKGEYEKREAQRPEKERSDRQSDGDF